MDNVKDKNPARKDGLTPLHFAAENGHINICDLIINVVDDKNPAAKNGSTPFSLAEDPQIRNLIMEKMKNS